MKKVLYFILIAILIASCFVSCNPKKEESTTAEPAIVETLEESEVLDTTEVTETEVDTEVISETEVESESEIEVTEIPVDETAEEVAE